jgi:hypothetical protein
MPRHCYFILQLILIAALLTSLAACRNTSKEEQPFRFKDEKSMREALKGSWILKEYADSVDAGLTPKLLAYMFASENTIDYYPDKTGKDSDVVVIWKGNSSQFTIDDQTFETNFDYKENKLFFSHHYKDTSGKDITQLDSAEFVVDGIDTTLIFLGDSNPHQGRSFIKYNVGSCPEMNAYQHLVNRRLITGKYYNVSDPQHLHHILFSSCGSIEGAGYISSSFSGFSDYDVFVENHLSGLDQISFSSKRDTRMDAQATIVDWSVNKDTLTIGVYKLIKSK